MSHQSTIPGSLPVIIYVSAFWICSCTLLNSQMTTSLIWPDGVFVMVGHHLDGTLDPPDLIQATELSLPFPTHSRPALTDLVFLLLYDSSMLKSTFRSQIKATRAQDSNGLVLCQCPDCYLNPSVHPSTGLPSTGDERGRWIMEREFGRHRSQHRVRATVELCLQGPDADHPPRVSSPSPSVLSPPQHSDIASPTASASPTPCRSPSTSPSATDQAIIGDLKALRAQVEQPPVLDTILVFRRPPSVKDVAIRPSKLDDISIDDLCALDSNVPSNSPVVGYSGILDRTKEHARSFLNHGNVAVRLQAKLNIQRVEEECAILRKTKLKEWR